VTRSPALVVVRGRIIIIAGSVVKVSSLCYNSDVMLTPQQKAKILNNFRVHDKDTGSPEAQIALFTEEIEKLTKHLKKHGKDNSSRVGLLKMVAKRKRLLDYLKRGDAKRYSSLVKKLGLK